MKWKKKIIVAVHTAKKVFLRMLMKIEELLVLKNKLKGCIKNE